MNTIQPQTTGRAPAVSDSQKLALTIPEFCKTHGISEAFYYQLQKEGRGPRAMVVGRRRLISIEEAKRWREERTAAA
jgi:predicted DNA-binding transcriptional regulator AlpA